MVAVAHANAGETNPLARLQAVLGDRYTVERPLGAGGMAVVYLAQDLRHRRHVALKMLRPDLSASLAASRFVREIEIAASLTHPHILPLHESGVEDGVFFYVMPYVAGGSLRHRLLREGQLPLEAAITLACETADALACAHEHGVVHRDVKPENILLEEGHAVVTDFGIARAISAAGDEPITEAGLAIGTPEYMSPEQASGDTVIDGRADQYALGCVLYEMLAGQPPFMGRQARAVLARHVMDAIPPLVTVRPGVPAHVTRAVTTALAKAPADRFATLRAFAEALVTPMQDDAITAVAVLPFVNLSGDAENDYLGDGIAEEIINALSKIVGLRVASRTSAFAFKAKHEDIRAIGEMLNVYAVLEGSVRKAGTRLRIAAQLVKVADGYQLWSERYDRGMVDVFAIQDEIAASIARSLRVMLRDDERRAVTKAPTAEVKAYDFYLRGLQFFHQRRKKGFIFARQMFKRAIRVDARYARAYAGIADCCSFLVHLYRDAHRRRNLEQADAASRKALELDPSLPEAHAARGFVLWLMGRDREAERAFRRAIELEPQQFEARYVWARACYQQGRLVEAARLFEEACGVREDHEARYFAAQSYSAMGQANAADSAYRRALPVIERHLALNPDDARAITMGAVSFSRIGDRARGLEWAERALAVDVEDASVRYNVACLFALEGEHDRAIACLEEAFRVGFANRDWIEHDPDLDSLRDDPRFQALLWSE